MEQQDYVVLREGFVLRNLRQPGEVVRLAPRQAQHMSNVMLKAQWDKLSKAEQQKYAGLHAQDEATAAAEDEDAAA